MRSLCAALFFSFHCYVAFGSNVVLRYEPAIIELSGVIEQQTFPGPPGYESIANGDRIEKGWYLRLSDAVDVVETKDDAPSAEAETERNVKILHLTLGGSPELIKAVKIATLLKKKVRLKGYLFHQWSGHHHSRVLMSVDQIEEIRK